MCSTLRPTTRQGIEIWHSKEIQVLILVACNHSTLSLLSQSSPRLALGLPGQGLRRAGLPAGPVEPAVAAAVVAAAVAVVVVAAAVVVVAAVAAAAAVVVVVVAAVVAAAAILSPACINPSKKGSIRDTEITRCNMHFIWLFTITSTKMNVRCKR